ncbi:Beta-lactamase [Penicillium malachiteum]|nr:Beta-lactamase [Penicillium malachiteum]
MSEINGTCDAKYEVVCQHLKETSESGVELRASIYVNLGSRCVLDIWGGYSDFTRTKLRTESTITSAWSMSKTITVLAVLILVNRGFLDVNAKVVQYWPELGVNWREDNEVRHILCHASRLSAWETPIDIEGFMLLSNPHLYSQHSLRGGHHILTSGNLLGELVKSVTKKSLESFIAEEMTALIQADYKLELEEMQGMPVKAEHANGFAIRITEIGAINGFGNTRSICRLLSMLAYDGIFDGIQARVRGADYLQIPCRWGMGFFLPSPDTGRFECLPREGGCYWGGWGGSIVIVDRIRQMEISHVMNQLEEASGAASKPDMYN